MKTCESIKSRNYRIYSLIMLSAYTFFNFHSFTLSSFPRDTSHAALFTDLVPQTLRPQGSQTAVDAGPRDCIELHP